MSLKNFIIYFCFFANGVVMSMKPVDLNDELPTDFVSRMPSELVRCASSVVEKKFDVAADVLLNFASRNAGFSSRFVKASKIEIANALSAHFNVVESYHKKGVYDKDSKLADFVRGTMLGSLYWSCCDMWRYQREAEATAKITAARKAKVRDLKKPIVSTSFISEKIALTGGDE